MPWYRWIFSRSDTLPGVTLYFLSKRNSTSPRFFPLYENTSKVRIVLVRGSRIPHSDFFFIRFIRIILRVFKSKFSQYNFFFSLDIPSSRFIKTNQILHIDDPLYSNYELEQIRNWETCTRDKGFNSRIVVTTEYMRKYFLQNHIESEIFIISQGFSSPEKYSLASDSKENSIFRLVYISPYIDSLGDSHSGHPMWDASVLIDGIWPQICSLADIELHLIGRIGGNAAAKLSQSNVFQHGFISIAQVAAILPDFDLALYPRTYDNRWQPQKIIEYMGAGVPILAFDMIDTKIVEELGIGVLVQNINEFIYKIHELKSNRSSLRVYKQNCLKYRNEYRWSHLGQELDKILENSESS